MNGGISSRRFSTKTKVIVWLSSMSILLSCWQDCTSSPWNGSSSTTNSLWELSAFISRSLRVSPVERSLKCLFSNELNLNNSISCANNSSLLLCPVKIRSLTRLCFPCSNSWASNCLCESEDTSISLLILLIRLPFSHLASPINAAVRADLPAPLAPKSNQCSPRFTCQSRLHIS